MEYLEVSCPIPFRSRVIMFMGSTLQIGRRGLDGSSLTEQLAESLFTM
jgi:hypothetical protein